MPAVRVRRTDDSLAVVEIPEGKVYEVAIYGGPDDNPYVRSEIVEADGAREARKRVVLEPGESIEAVGVLDDGEVAVLLLHGATLAGKDPR